MKTMVRILLGIINFILLLLSLIFIVIEIRLLISLDWIIYDNPINGFIRYFLRLLLAAYALGISILTYINMVKKNKRILSYLYLSCFSLLTISLVLIFTTTNYVGLICFSLSIVYTTIYSIYYKISF